MAKIKIMVVEDESMVMEYIIQNLRFLGYTVVANANSGEEAIEKAGKNKPHLILMDIRLKGKVDGIEAAGHIRNRFHIPTVYLTSYSDDKTLARAKLTVPLGYLMKPFERSELKSIIEVAIFKHRMDLKLQESENKFRSVFENSLDTIYIARKDGRIQDINKVASRFLGYSIEELLKLNITQLFSKPNERRIFQSALEKKGYIKDFEISLSKKDQTPIVGLTSATVAKDENGNITGYHGIIRDITETKRLEEQLLQAVKMGAIGRLASGIAHDFNNLLTIIIGYTETLFKYVQDHQGKINIDKILKAGEKASLLIKKILAFSRKQESYPVVVNINNVVGELEAIARSSIGENIEIETRLSSDVGKIYIDTSQLEQVMMNIIVNARDAMPDGGKIVLMTQNFTFNDKFIRSYAGAKKGNFVELNITDTGTGMSKTVLDKIFEPFFTTKKREEGTGLGMATVYGIMKQNKGFIYINSQLGQGSTFRVFFPRVSQAEGLKEVSMEKRQDLNFKEKTVLLVEDEENVLDLAKSILESLGFHVFAVSNGEDAIKTAKLYKENLDLLFIDVVLPGVGGKDVAEKVTKLHPETKVIFSSGYPEDYIFDKGLDVKKVAFVKKPYNEAIIPEILKKVLGD